MKRPFDITEEEQSDPRLASALADLYRPSRDDQASLAGIRQRLQAQATEMKQSIPTMYPAMPTSDPQLISFPKQHKPRKVSRGLRVLGILAAVLVTALVVGSFAFLHTSWKPQTASNPPTITMGKQVHRLVISDSLYMASPSTGWAIAAKGKTGDILPPRVLLRTTDGGKSWQDVSPMIGSGSDIPNVFVLDETTAWYVDLQDKGETPFYRTTDGGKSWQRCANPMNTENDSLLSLAFVNAKDGWLLTGQGERLNNTLYQTHNGGKSWQKMVQITESASSTSGIRVKGQPNQLTFTDQLHGYITTTPYQGSPAMLYATQDGGKSWKEHALPIPSGWKSTQLQAIEFTFTSDGRDSFLLSFVNATTKRIQSYLYTGHTNTWDVKAFSTNYSRFLAGNERQIMVETLEGDSQSHHRFVAQLYTLQSGTWKVENSSPFPNQTFVNLSFADAQHGWALVKASKDNYVRADANIQFRVTNDGCKTWTTVHPTLPKGVLWIL